MQKQDTAHGEASVAARGKVQKAIISLLGLLSCMICVGNNNYCVFIRQLLGKKRTRIPSMLEHHTADGLEY